MPHKSMSSTGLASVEAYAVAIERWLQKAEDVKQEASIDPALVASDFFGEIENINTIRTESNAPPQAHYAAIETAIRNAFYDLLASSSIDQPSFGAIWNLLDIVVIISDNEYCEPTLVIWLVEELLDSQTILGCRIIFDYLESRREQIIATHFKSKSLAILRACNELLRRLSRAEDTVFCGRVFIFLFQSFPLGDRSSVNLRGEYHVDNVTAYDETSNKAFENTRHMDVDTNGINEPEALNSTMSLETESAHTNGVAPNLKETKAVTFEPVVGDRSRPTLDAETLYPMFWSLQHYFSTPTTLFDAANLKAFKDGLEATLEKFKEVQKETEARGNLKPVEESRHGVKRKRGATGEEIASSFNPKYLTSRDLFELEISDMAFRRHVLVQALILIDFLLSLTPKSKSKVEDMKNKSVLYDYTLSEDESKWAMHMRSEIANYLQQGTEGKFYYRMVDTVLLRDKNWVRWKVENCPPFQRNSITPAAFVEARNGAQKACDNKRLRATPLGSLDLSFLSDGETADGLDKFKDPDRYAIPTAEDFKGPIADDDFDAQNASSSAEDRQLASHARASKIWRLLRTVRRNKFNLFDRIDDGNNIEALFEEDGAEKRSHNTGDEDVVDRDEHPAKAAEVPAVTVSGPMVAAVTAVQ